MVNDKYNMKNLEEILSEIPELSGDFALYLAREPYEPLIKSFKRVLILGKYDKDRRIYTPLNLREKSLFSLIQTMYKQKAFSKISIIVDEEYSSFVDVSDFLEAIDSLGYNLIEKVIYLKRSYVDKLFDNRVKKKLGLYKSKVYRFDKYELPFSEIIAYFR